jgi:hypothetical protein
MRFYRFRSGPYSSYFKSVLILYQCITMLTILNAYLTVYGGGIFITAINYCLVFVIMLAVWTNRSRQTIHALNLYILWIVLFAFIYIILFQIIASRHDIYKTYLGIDMNYSVLHLINILPVAFISWYILQNKDSRFNIILTYITTCLLLINIVFTLNALRNDPDIVRLLATGVGGEQYYLEGVSGFDITYSAVILVPYFLYSTLYASTKKMRALFASCGIITIIYIYKCSFNIAILATALGICIFLYALANTTSKVFLGISISIIALAAVRSFVVYDVLSTFFEALDIEHVKWGLGVATEMLIFGDSGREQLKRLETYRQSIDGFLRSPISGIFVLDPNYVLSDHSTILDLLAGAGLIGFIPFAIFLYYSFKYSMAYSSSTMYKQCIIASYIIFLFISIFNPQMSSPNVLLTLLVINPIMCSTTESGISVSDKSKQKTFMLGVRKGSRRLSQNRLGS